MRVTLETRDLLAGRIGALGGARAPQVKELGALALPPVRAEWLLDAAYLGAATKHSASSLEALVGCPLKWVFRYPAGLHAGALASIASGPRLYGNLGHRLVEELHRANALQRPEEFEQTIAALLDKLLREEAAVLLRPGMSFELAQLREQVTGALVRLGQILSESLLTVVDVEVTVESPWRAGELHGRIDLLLRDERGQDVVLDLKWGRGRYAQMLEKGIATQLAVYAAARKGITGAELPAAAYFSLKRGEILATRGMPFAHYRPIDGPSLSHTWERLERTVERVEASLQMGRVPVTGVRRSLPVLEALGVVESEREAHLAPEESIPCTYCEFDALCGRKWEGVA